MVKEATVLNAMSLEMKDIEKVIKRNRGGSTLTLKTNENNGNLDKSFPPNEDSIKIIKKLINE